MTDHLETPADARPPVSARQTNATRVMRPEQLTARHRLLVEYMVHGVEHESLRSRLPPRYIPAGFDTDGAPLQKLSRPALHEALTLEDAAAVCGIRARAARQLARQPAFQRLLSEETSAFRDGAKARVIRRIESIVHDPGAGKAADRKVQLVAAQLLMGEGGNAGTSVIIHNTVGVLTAGCVIDLREDDEIERDNAIQHEGDLHGR